MFFTNETGSDKQIYSVETGWNDKFCLLRPNEKENKEAENQSCSRGVVPPSKISVHPRLDQRQWTFSQYIRRRPVTFLFHMGHSQNKIRNFLRFFNRVLTRKKRGSS